MAILTEKEIEIESGLFQAKIYSEYRDSELDKVFVTILIDGYPVTWSWAHNHGMIEVLHAGAPTKDWERLMALLNQEYCKMLQVEIGKLIEA